MTSKNGVALLARQHRGHELVRLRRIRLEPKRRVVCPKQNRLPERVRDLARMKEAFCVCSETENRM
jgi:hypothetical protein